MDDKYVMQTVGELPADCLGTVGLKSKRSVYVCCMAGLVFILALHNSFGILLGGFFLVLAGVVQFVQKDRKVMSVCPNEIFLYDSTHDDLAIRLQTDEITEWCVNKNGNYAIVFKLKDGEQFSGQSYQVHKAVQLLKQVMPNKSLEVVQMERLKQMRKDKKK